MSKRTHARRTGRWLYIMGANRNASLIVAVLPVCLFANTLVGACSLMKLLFPGIIVYDDEYVFDLLPLRTTMVSLIAFPTPRVPGRETRKAVTVLEFTVVENTPRLPSTNQYLILC